MELLLQFSATALSFAMAAFITLVLWRVLYSCWVLPIQVYRKLRTNGFSGPPPSFPLGNITEMRKLKSSETDTFFSSSNVAVSHDIHSAVFPYFARWQTSHGKVFMYWLGTEPFIYIADPEFLMKISSGVMGKSWGKPSVFKHDRKPMFGSGLLMSEGEDWVRHRHIITPAFSPQNLKAMGSLMVESTTNLLDHWTSLINSGKSEIDVERDITRMAGEIIAKISIGMDYESGKTVLEKLRAMQTTLFKSNRYVGVPFSKYLSLKKNQEANRLGDEIDAVLLRIIEERRERMMEEEVEKEPQKNLLGLLLLEENMSHVVDEKKKGGLSVRELVDECKTFFFAGHETSALALTWTLLLLAMYPNWQDQLRKEIKEVFGDKEIDTTMLVSLKKMGWVMSEVLRLYPSGPNAQRQVRADMRVGEDMVIPNGTNLWIDIVALHHDREIWGDDVNEFKPERFKDDLNGGCYHKMGYLPFGFGGRMCVGRNLTAMEYKIVLTLILTKFSISLSPNYSHSPSIMLTLRPFQGLPLILRHL